LAFALFPVLLAQETLVPVEVNQLKPLLDFEAGPAGGVPKGWRTSPGKVSIDDKIVHHGQFSARLQSGSVITLMAPVTFSGDLLTLRGFLKTEGVTEFAGLWMRVDGNSGNPVGYENMRSQGLRGSTDWKEYSIRVPLASNGTYMYFGVLTEGGTTWADDLELLIDGRPVWDVPPKTLAAAQPITLSRKQSMGAACSRLRFLEGTDFSKGAGEPEQVQQAASRDLTSLELAPFFR